MINPHPPAPLISVCMPCYNNAPYLKGCIDSILAQSFGDFELLIVDDGSEDESARIIESYDDRRIFSLSCKYICTLRYFNQFITDDTAYHKYVMNLRETLPVRPVQTI